MDKKLLIKAAEMIQKLVEQNKELKAKLAQAEAQPQQAPPEDPKVQLIEQILQLMLNAGLITADQVAAKRVELSQLPIDQLQQIQIGLTQQQQPVQGPATPPPPQGGAPQNPSVGKVASMGDINGKFTDDDLYQVLLDL